MKGKSLPLITLSLLLVLGLGGGIGGLWEEARAEEPQAPGQAPLLAEPVGTLHLPGPSDQRRQPSRRHLRLPVQPLGFPQ